MFHPHPLLRPRQLDSSPNVAAGNANAYIAIPANVSYRLIRTSLIVAHVDLHHPPTTRRSPSGRVPFDTPLTTSSAPPSATSPRPPLSLSPRQLGQRRHRKRERLCRDQPPTSPPSPATAPL